MVTELAVTVADDLPHPRHVATSLLVGIAGLHSRDRLDAVREGHARRRPDAAAWPFTVTEAGEFDVEVLQGCGKGQGGSPMSVVFNPGAAESRLGFTVEDTGGFQQFRPRVIGRVTPAAGDHLLHIQPERIAKASACDIRQVRLLPTVR